MYKITQIDYYGTPKLHYNVPTSIFHQDLFCTNVYTRLSIVYCSSSQFRLSLHFITKSVFKFELRYVHIFLRDCIGSVVTFCTTVCTRMSFNYNNKCSSFYYQIHAQIPAQVATCPLWEYNLLFFMQRSFLYLRMNYSLYFIKCTRM